MDTDFMEGEVVHLDGVDALAHVVLHPPSHLAVAHVGKILDSASELSGVGNIIGGMFKDEGGNLEERGAKRLRMVMLV